MLQHNPHLPLQYPHPPLHPHHLEPQLLAGLLRQWLASHLASGAACREVGVDLESQLYCSFVLVEQDGFGEQEDQDEQDEQGEQGGQGEQEEQDAPG